jgi:hypothetical protein
MTAVEWFIQEINRKGCITDKDYEYAINMELQQALDLIELTAQLTGVSTVDEEIAKMEYIDVYKLYYKEKYGK